MKRIVVAITGASGIPLAITCLEELRKTDYEIHLIMSKSAKLTLQLETNYQIEDIYFLMDVVHENEAIGDNIASGTYLVSGVIVIPCSMKTLGGIRNGYSDNLINRVVDVNIKEQRKVILVTREAPLSSIHLDNLAYLARIPNLFIIPPVLTYYQHPKTIKDMEIHIVGKILEKFDIDISDYKRWDYKK